ncbi:MULTISPECIES: thioredoxin domain-containing protein [Limnochorda]|uniref:thioredoxin domain-containing protein n=1 Tax=Limnochorda TaxID=1676651 RepID=UPI001D9F0FE8|nr:thioredoxin domain-containing protein [Limnochorda pilosa]MBO2486452.1 thioredoxin domain-containing protein [Bacillota bacterium]MBO2520066.1 thioredoxin domain-containing protein [Bacillota bacterium]
MSGLERSVPGQANRLAAEESLYLRQHASNPVDWYPWGPEALEQARREDRPILLSIGYSACHWCHVMEAESFSDPAIAEVMNRHFVCIKVDREERPDLDHLYQQAAELLGSGGGWPLTVFLTPQGAPFYAGTYFPPVERYGLPAFPDLLETLAQIFREERDRVEQVASQVVAALRALQEPPPGRPPERIAPAPDRLVPAPRRRVDVEAALRVLDEHADRAQGGFGRAPKFPNVPLLRLFLAQARFGRDDRAEARARHALFTLDRILAGGIHDQLGGGFHRYATDNRWLVPHFEKMLYDNGLIPWVLLEAYQLTGAVRYRLSAQAALEYLIREMRHPEGPFAASQDADTEGVEGGTYLWTPAEVEAVLGAEEAQLAIAWFGVTPEGHLEGRSVLHQALAPEEAAERFGLSMDVLEDRLAAIGQRLLEARQRRPQPQRDDKVLTAWNGLAIATLARAAAVLGEGRYLEAARQAFQFILDHLVSEDGGLQRVWRRSGPPVAGQLDDHAYLAWGALELYQATFEPSLLQALGALAGLLMERFWDGQAGDFFLTAAEPGETPLLGVRPRQAVDQAVPAPAAVAAGVLLAAATLLGREAFREPAERLVERYQAAMVEHPWPHSSLLLLAQLVETGWTEVTLAAPPGMGGEALMPWLEAAFGPYAPERLAAGGALRGLWGDQAVRLPRVWQIPLPHPLPFLAGREHDGRVRAYHCRNFTCSPPLDRPEALRQLLSQGVRFPSPE